MKTKEALRRKLITSCIQKGHLDSLVSLSIGLKYKLGIGEVHRCLEVGKPGSRFVDPVRSARDWKRMGNYERVVATAVEAMVEYGCHGDVVAIAQGIDTREIYTQILGADLDEELHQYLPLVAKIGAEDRWVLEKFLKGCLWTPDLDTAKAVIEKLGRSFRADELDEILSSSLKLPDTDAAIEICTLRGRSLTKKEGNLLIRSNIENGDPCELMIALRFVGRELTSHELSRFLMENS